MVIRLGSLDIVYFHEDKNGQLLFRVAAHGFNKVSYFLEYIDLLKNFKKNFYSLVIIVLVFVPQILVVPYFFNSENKAKALYLCFFCFLFLAIFTIKKFNFYKLDIFLILILIIPSLSAFFSKYYFYSCVSLVYIFSIIIFRHILVSSFEKNVDLRLIFLRIFSGFILIVSLLCFYQYFCFFFLGKSSVPLIPYLLPPNESSRISGIYGQPNFTSLLLLVGLLAYFYLYLHDTEYQTTRLRWLQFFPFLTVTIVFFLTGSRAGFLAFVLTFLLLCWLVVRHRYLNSRPSQRKRFCSLLVVVIGGFCIAYGLNSISLMPGIRALSPGGSSSDTRFLLWAAAVLIFIDHPWLGVGIENFKFYLPKYANSAHDFLGFVEYEAMGYTSWAHNEFLQLVCEGGVIVFLALSLAIGSLFYQIIMYAKGRRNWSPLKLYSHFFLIPFVIQSMFSWPMRYTPLVILFFTFLSLLLSQYHWKTINIPVFFQNILRSIAVFGLVVTLLISIQEIRMESLKEDFKNNSVHGSFSNFERLATDSYSEFPLLLKLLPRYIHIAISEENVVLAEKVLPYIQRLTEIQGTYWQWFYLGHIYHLVGRRDDAMKAVKNAIDLRPTEQVYWGFQHYLNMLNAADETGQPLEDFIPIPPEGTSVNLEGQFDFENKIKINY